jgi:hypothetical protein
VNEISKFIYLYAVSGMAITFIAGMVVEHLLDKRLAKKRPMATRLSRGYTH